MQTHRLIQRRIPIQQHMFDKNMYGPEKRSKYDLPRPCLPMASPGNTYLQHEFLLAQSGGPSVIVN